MDSFLLTKYTIGDGLGMGSYSPGHLLWLLMIAAVIAVLGRKYRTMDGKGQRVVLLVLAALSLADELFKDIVPIATEQWNWAFLPLHICSISIFAIIAHALTRSSIAAEFLYAVSLPTAAMALVFPNWTAMLPCCNYESIHSFSIHGLIVIYTAMLLYGGFRPSAGRLRYVVVIFLALAAVAYAANAAFGTNFFFLSSGDEGNPLGLLERYIGKGYLIAFPVIAALCWLPMYMIPMHLEKRR